METIVRDDEVLQPSSLRSYNWPAVNPMETVQSVRLMDKSDTDNISRAATNIFIEWRMFEKNTRGRSLAEKIFELITNHKFQFNTRNLILNEKIWLDRIQSAIVNKEPILIVYPLFCKIINWAKQMTNTGPNAGEEATIMFFKHINKIVKNIYSPGIKFILVTDAHLYGKAFGNSPQEVQKYIDGCSKLIVKHDTCSFIEIFDYATLLDQFSDEYHSIYTKFNRLINTNPDSLLKDINSKTLFESVKSSINTNEIPLSYKDRIEIFSFYQNEENKYYKDVQHLAETAYKEIISIRLTCSELNIFDKIWPNHVRATCHKGLKNGIAVVGLRPYPEYYRSSKLLTYHGVPLLSKAKQEFRLEILPEVMLRGRSDLVRVVDREGETYYYDSTSPCKNSFKSRRECSMMGGI